MPTRNIPTDTELRLTIFWLSYLGIQQTEADTQTACKQTNRSRSGVEGDRRLRRCWEADSRWELVIWRGDDLQVSVSHVFTACKCDTDMQSNVEHSDSEKNITIRFDFPKRTDFFDSAHHCRIGVMRIGCYRLCQMSTLLRHHESLSQLHKDVGCDVSYNDWAECCYIK